MITMVGGEDEDAWTVMLSLSVPSHAHVYVCLRSLAWFFVGLAGLLLVMCFIVYDVLFVFIFDWLVYFVVCCIPSRGIDI